ncbi:T9SS type A sorting domain-containing protein, partial [candidate division KSB1 bacterium]|nr:T9SS type A sorting domain-containing protein [candidate division KSB1 bacterium]
INAESPAERDEILFGAENQVIWYKMAIGEGELLSQCFECMRVCPIAIQAPLADNTGQAASIATPADARGVRTLDVGLAIQSFAITSPSGATDNILSTDQDFIIQATLTSSENIDSVSTELVPASGYSLFPGSNPLVQEIGTGQQTTNWTFVTPSQAHQSRTFELRVRGFIGGQLRENASQQFGVVAVFKANIDFDNFQSNTSQIVKLSVGQQFQLSALVNNTGQAGINGSAQLTLDLASTGISSQESLIQTFIPGTPVIWNVTAPNTPVPAQSISVTLSQIPLDENTNDQAAVNPPLVRTIQIETGEVGGLTIDNISVSAPQGAADGVISTEQQFTIIADYSWQDAIDLSASIVLPTGYGANSLTQNLTSQSGNQSLQWQITAPVNATPQEFIQFTASGKDASSGDQVNAQPDSLPFTTIEKARLNFNAEITAPSSAIDRIVTIGQLFTVTASLPNTGEAGLVGEDTVRITLPPGYTITEPFVKALTPGAPATWQIKAPDDPTTILDILVEIIDRNARDENTNDFPPLTPSPARVTIPVQTQAIGLNLTLLDQRKPTIIVRGGTNSVFGLRFKNNSDTDIDIQSIDLSVKDNQNNDIAPNSVFTNLSVVDYDNNSTSFASISPPGANPLTVNFTPALRIAPSQVQSIEFLVSIAAQTDGNHFLLSIDSPQDDISAIDVGSTEQVDIRDDSSGVRITSALGAGVVSLTDPELEASFFNYPNPFGQNGRATTFLNYNLAQASNVTIRIYTLLGELVKTYQFQATDAAGAVGDHFDDVSWDGTNEKGQTVLNGVYVAVLITDSGKAMTKIAVAR